MTDCILHRIGDITTTDGKVVPWPGTVRTFPRVPCIGEDLVDGSGETWRVVGVAWTADKSVIELSLVERFDATNPPRIFTEGGSAASSEDAASTARSDAHRPAGGITPGHSIVAPALRGAG